MAEIILIKAERVKEITSISDNVAGKYLKPSIREAQECGLRSILGDALLDTIKARIADETIGLPENARLRTIIERSEYYLAYRAVAETSMKVSYKVANFGVAKSTDTNLQVASQDEIVKLQFYYESKADDACYKLQSFLLDNRSLYPELTDNHCNQIKSNLTSSASCGLWLGGARGRRRARR